MIRIPSQLLLLAALPVLATIAGAEEQPLSTLPKALTPVPNHGARDWHITHNLGATGARGWIKGSSGHTRESREILIKSVEPGSPGDGVLQPYDVIVGAAVPPDTPSMEWTTAPAVKGFDSDARLAMARAITWAESTAGKGELKLLCVRDGVQGEVVVQLPTLGDYAKTAPFDCPKSATIAKQAAAFLAENMPADGFGPGVGRPLNAAMLLASENPAYLDHVRRSACRMSLNHTVNDAGHETWRWGNTNVFLCEYYLATGDERVLPTIEEYCRVLAEGQCNPGTWGHRAVPDFIPPGYGSLNSSGVVCFLSLILGDQCGVTVDETALRNSIRFYGSYAGRGGIPYGDHPPSYNASSNGKNGAAGVAFHQLGAEPAAQWFSRLACSSNLEAFEGGHTGNFFNQTWTPLGASLSGRENYAGFWARFNSYRDLARRWDGSFMTQPFPHTREGDLGTGNYVSKGPLWTTGGFALSYLADSGKLAILGRTESVFGKNPPAELQEALALFRAKQFAECVTAAQAFSEAADPEVRCMAAQLAGAAGRNLESIGLTLADMQATLDAGDLFKLQAQLQAIESVVDAGDERLKDFRAAVGDPANAEVIAEGAQFHRYAKEIRFAGPKGFQLISAPGAQLHSRSLGTMKTMAQRGKGGYQALAQAHLEALPAAPVIAEKTLVSGPGKEGSEWFVASDGRMVGAFEVENPEAITELALDYVCGGELKVSLNDTLIMHLAPPGGSTRYDRALIPLKPSTRKLLQRGTNHLAVEIGGAKVDAVQVALKAAVK